MSAVGQDHPEIGIEPSDQEIQESQESHDAPEIKYATLIDRAETIRTLIEDGTLDPEVGLSYIVWPTPLIEEAQQQRREHDAQQQRRRFTPEARERALMLVQGGVSYRIAASVALGDERHRMTVWRWARREKVA